MALFHALFHSPSDPDLVGSLACQLKDVRIGTEHLLLAGQHGFDTVGQILVTFWGEVEGSKVEDQSLSGAVFGADVFHEVQVLVEAS